MSSKVAILATAFLLLTISTTAVPALRSDSSAAELPIIVTAPSYIELGYSVTTLAPVQNGIPVYSVGDSLWILSTSSLVISAELLSPNKVPVSSRNISVSAAYFMYKFSESDTTGDWTIRTTLVNSSTVTIKVPFVNPRAYEIGARLFNYTLNAGELSLNFALLPSRGFNFVGCVAGSDVNSTIQIPIPGNLGSGIIVASGNLDNANLSALGEISQTFSLNLEWDYSYSYAGNYSGEFFSSETTTMKSSPAVFSPTVNKSEVSLANNTTPRFGPYRLNAYFESGSGLVVEQSTVLLSNNGNWIWLGNCNPFPVSAAIFSNQETLSDSSDHWPRVLYLTYDVAGVDSYSALSLNLNLSRIDLLGEYTPPSTGPRGLGYSVSKTSISYLDLRVAHNPSILAYNLYNDTLYIVGSDYPIAVQIHSMFGSTTLAHLNIELSKPFSVVESSIAVGLLTVQARNESSTLVNVQVTVDNREGGRLSDVTNATGFASFFIPSGNYSVTVTSSYTESQNVSISVNSQSRLEFNFIEPTNPNSLLYPLISIVIIGFLLDIWIVLFRRRQ